MPLPNTDLITAVINQLESVTTVDAAFGDTWNQLTQAGVSKFFGDTVDQVPPPWCQIQETGETYQFMTRQQNGAISYLADGQLTFSITATDRFTTRLLGLLIAKALNDYPLLWPFENEMLFRMSRSSFMGGTDTGPGVSVLFNRMFVFDYQFSGVL